MDQAEEIKRKLEATVKIMAALAEFDGKEAIEILTGVLISIVTVAANKGKEEEIMDSIINALKDGMEFVKNTPPINIPLDAIVEQLKGKYVGKAELSSGQNPNLN